MSAKASSGLPPRFATFIAIDFGTTYSGFALVVGKDSDRYFVQPQISSGDEAGRKEPTALLLDKEKKLVAFGRPAMERYFNDIEEESERDDYYFFDRFKMKLKDDKVRREDT